MELFNCRGRLEKYITKALIGSMHCKMFAILAQSVLDIDAQYTRNQEE